MFGTKVNQLSINYKVAILKSSLYCKYTESWLNFVQNIHLSVDQNYLKNQEDWFLDHPIYVYTRKEFFN